MVIAIGGWAVWKWIYIPQRAQENLELAKSLILEGKSQEAIPFAAYADEHLRENAEARFVYAEALSGAGQDTTRAFVLYQKAYLMDSGNYLISLRMAHFDRTLGNTPHAIQILERLLKDYPDSSQVYYERGITYAQMGDLQKAYSFFTHSIELDGDNLDALRARGEHSAHIQDFQRAIADWNRIISSGQDDGTLLAQRGKFKVKIMDYEGARTDLREALLLGIGDAQLRIALGQAYLNTDMPDSALLTVQEGLRLYPQSDSLLRLRAFTYLRSQKNKEAVVDFDRIIGSKGEDLPQMYYLRGIAKTQSGNYKGAVDDYSEAIKQDNKLTDAYFNRGLSYAYQNDFPNAIKDYTEVIARQPNYAMAYYVRGVAYISLDQFKDGCPDLKKAAELGNAEANKAMKTYCKD